MQNMGLTILSLNANSAAISRNGSVGGILISVSHVTRNRLKETMCLKKQGKTCRNARVLQHVHSKLSILKMARNMLWGVLFLEI